MLIRSDESVMVDEATIAFTFERLMQPLVVVEGDPVEWASPFEATGTHEPRDLAPWTSNRVDLARRASA
jgi:hypothetical protein